ncbi:MAG: SUMF1/EgtB/PvdO family nonheme iron enzyme [Pseudomonadales bacterium]|jgi:formylglycine-generating enzyme required for sulfatase activity|nr:SUMF1/EgtB/PvdO family nonheme iron enzyme [Pseudomonadales bacterium]
MDRIGEMSFEALLLEGARGRLWRAVDEASGRRLTVHLATPGAPGPAFGPAPAGPHLAAVRIAGELGDGIPWYATDWIDGSLDALFREAVAEPVAAQRSIALLEQLLAALGAAHAGGQVHLGLDPRVVRLGEDGGVELLGFGVGPSLDALVDGTDARAVDPAAVLVRACRAPELDDADTPVDARADLYAVAVLAHRLLTGGLPQRSDPDPDLMVDRILSGRNLAAPWVPPSRLNRALPLPLGDWIMQGLAPDPADRFADAATMRAALLATAGAARQETGERAPRAAPPAPRDLPETIEALIDAAQVGSRQRETLRDLAAAVRTDAGGSDGAPPDRTRQALRDAAQAAGMDVAHLDALLLGRYRPRRASGATRPAPAPPAPGPEPAEVVAAAAETAQAAPAEAAAGAGTKQPASGDDGARGRSVLVAVVIIALVALLLLVAGGDPSTGPSTPSPGDVVPAPVAGAGTPEPSATHEPFAPGTRYRDPLASGGEGPELVVVPAGSFRMGCVSGLRCAPDELPVRQVRIPRAFAVGVYEVTFEDYDRFTAETGRVRSGDERWGRGRHPAINVSWEEAQAYLAWLSAETGARYRLPTEAEWEYVARAGSETPWFFGTDATQLCAHGNGADALTAYERRNDTCNDGVGRRTAEAGSYRANAFGLHDTLGNLWEWVEDCYAGSYETAPADGSAREVDGTCPTRTLRGGGLNSGPDELRTANRERNSPTLSLYYIGFRVVREL